MPQASWDTCHFVQTFLLLSKFSATLKIQLLNLKLDHLGQKASIIRLYFDLSTVVPLG